MKQDLRKKFVLNIETVTYLGKEKDNVEGVIKILDKRFSSQWGAYNYVAVMDGNLVLFMNKFEHEIGQ